MFPSFMVLTKKSKIQPPATIQNFPVIGIGASAGGLDAFKQFLKAISEKSGMAYVLVQHLNPSHESILPEILDKVTNIPVNEITDDIHLAPDHIYVIPANKILTTYDGVLKLEPRENIKKNQAIDVFFSSLAAVHKELAVGIVLSGTGSDGSLGLEAIKEHGGMTFAQDQESAAHGEMPESAVNAGVVDFVMPPEKMPDKLLQIAIVRKEEVDTDEETWKNDTVYRQILALLQQQSNVDFTYYKQTTIRRRIARRMFNAKTENIAQYLKVLRADKSEQQALFQDLLIPVTSFFRDPITFDALSEKVLPILFKNRAEGEPIRIWVAGCSTGQEAFTMAICLCEYLGDKIKDHRIQIFASDISEIAIRRAREGKYSKIEVQMLSEARLEKYFTETNGSYLINKDIRDMCVFAIQNFLKDPPFAKIDLISCRNVLIYMNGFLQKKALNTFHYALQKNGFLILGKSETPSVVSESFSIFIRNLKIYTRKSVPGRFMHVATERKDELAAKKDMKVAKADMPLTGFRKTAEAILLSRYTPASVIVNDQMDIVHIHGIITPFLEPSPGKPTYNIFKMAREGLGFELRNALYKAKSTNAQVIKEGIPSKINGQQQLVTIDIIPLINTVEPHFLIVFEKTPQPELFPAGQGAGSESSASQLRIEHLENELAQTREDMRNITEEQEAANEELQTASEELQSSSEEMQSLNEELETSREELQSSNEELVILNQELLDKQEQVNTARLYSEAIVTTIREPLIILDKSLRIKTANTSFYKKFNFNEKDTVDKLFYELQDNQWDDHVLRSLLEKILPQKTRLEDFEIILNFPSLGERTMLLNARQVLNEVTAEKLILLAIEDITERKTAELNLKNFSEELEAKVKERTADLVQTNMQLEQFAHAASHDLQEPLRKIVTFSNRLQAKHKNEFSEEVSSYLEKIEGASTRMSRLIQDLLNYSYLINHDILFAPTDLDETLKDILNDFELLIDQKKAKITSDTLPIIEAIPLQMNQLFYNLISNALKFSLDNVPPVIHISIHSLSEKETKKHPGLNSRVKYCEIIFKDNGIGFDQKYDEQIFTIFQRLNQPAKYQGTGIGLALTKKIIENHHGEIYVEAKEYAGAAFHIILPIQQFDTMQLNKS
ncbi:chemotaxis protein CheB [Dyadobacter subterraneus]|uniref:PAS domain-containing protein n=2 Tax=Dyadobacter subterraneus TaxID=2773304 RepID=A0ABR9WFV3_9BACT|nr:chemotaxis protein CheB [Dyadobacter subterraneus]MBE9464305.1 PAS domain-containing protein [Dyadobacter subterraneus]